MQSRRMSLVEAITNVAVGYVIVLLMQIIVFPLFALHVSLGENLAIGALFTLPSNARSYTLRRTFEVVRTRGTQTSTAGRGARRHRLF